MTGPGNRERFPDIQRLPRSELEARCVRAEEVAERIKTDSERDTHRTYGEAHMYEVGRRDAAVAILSALAAVSEKDKP